MGWREMGQVDDRNGASPHTKATKAQASEPINGDSLVDRLYEFLVPRIELAGAPMFCSNPLTYRADERVLYGSFRAWVCSKGIRVPTTTEFHDAMSALFPEPHATYDSPRREWWGFCFIEVRPEQRGGPA